MRPADGGRPAMAERPRIEPRPVERPAELCDVCADRADAVRVLRVDGDTALVEDGCGRRREVATDLVAPVRLGEALLTHAGVALARLAEVEAP